uniref:Dynein light chain n=1 Tax=Trichobilharzia regenti TaxID=157069 RepID=A0AA85JRS6_TRIRE|nr:unnamed protein product [Trichobilharzia regenti]
MEPEKAIVKSTGMPEEMQEHAIKTCVKAMRMHRYDKDIASALKREFNNKYGPTWHCVVGCSYGSNVSHTEGGLMYFFLGRRSILLFKTESD